MLPDVRCLTLSLTGAAPARPRMQPFRSRGIQCRLIRPRESDFHRVPASLPLSPCAQHSTPQKAQPSLPRERSNRGTTARGMALGQGGEKAKSIRSPARGDRSMPCGISSDIPSANVVTSWRRAPIGLERPTMMQPGRAGGVGIGGAAFNRPRLPRLVRCFVDLAPFVRHTRGSSILGVSVLVALMLPLHRLARQERGHRNQGPPFLRRISGRDAPSRTCHPPYA